MALCAASLLESGRAQGFQTIPYWEREQGYIALRQAAKDAATDLQALIVASHPDDRHVLPTAYLRFARGWRVATLLMTRGEGGQNSKGPEIGDELGWRRTLEAEACAALVDAELWYLDRQDAGFSRSAGEALDLWGREDTIQSMARVIREIRPDVVLTTHDPDERHGHDLALLQVLPEAVVLAADPTFESQRAPWTVSKVFRGPATGELADVRDMLPTDQMDRVRGATYRQLAYAALKKHESQEPIRPMEELFAKEVRLYPALAEARADPDAWMLLEGLPSLFRQLPDTSENRFLKRDLDDLVDKIGLQGTLVQDAIALYDRLSRVAVEADSELALRRARRLEALARVVLHGSGFRVTAEVPAGTVPIAGRRFALELRVHNGGDPIFRDLRVETAAGGELQIDSASRDLLARLPAMTPFTVRAEAVAAPEALDRTKWLEDLFGAERFVAPIQLRCRVRVDDQANTPFDLEFPVVVQADVRPPIELEVFPRALVLPNGKTTGKLTVNITRHTEDPLETTLEVLGPPGFVVHPSPARVEMHRAKYQDFQFDVRVPGGLRAGVYNLHVLLGDLRHVVSVHKIDVNRSEKLVVGLVRGVDDTAQQVLRAYFEDRCELLDAEELASRSLDRFDTIVVDIRALRARPDSSTWKAARAAFPRFLEFVERGGRLVVFYHKDTEFNPEVAGFVGAPFPMQLGKVRVTREDAPVEVVSPDHVLLNYPNEIHPQDWDGWVQERGLYFPEIYADEYEEIVAMADTGQVKSRAALLYAKYGKGEYIYCALALYRQLDTLHPGACRIFANLVSR